MTKLQFLLSLHEKLKALPRGEVEERLTFYSEMIEDRMEEGLSEEDAVAAVGTVAEIAAQISAELPPAKAAKKPQRQLKAWEIVLLTLGSPIWLSLLIAAFAVILSLYVSLWSVIIALWAVFASLAACALGGFTAGTVFIANGSNPSGLALIGAGAVCAGLAISFFFACRAATLGAVLLTQKTALLIKNRFSKQEAAA